MGLSNDTFLKSIRNVNTITEKDNVTVHWGKFIPNICKDLKGTWINSVHWIQAVPLGIWGKRITSCRVASRDVAITMSSLLNDFGVACVMTKLTSCSADTATWSHWVVPEDVLICNQVYSNHLLSTARRSQITAISDSSGQFLLKLEKKACWRCATGTCGPVSL